MPIFFWPEGRLIAARKPERNPARWPSASEVQTLLFDRRRFNVRQAWAWAKRHGFKQTSPDVTDDKVRLRQADPALFSDFRTIALTDGVQAVVGPRRGAAARGAKRNPSPVQNPRAPSSKELGRWFNAQSKGDYTCTDCGKVGEKTYVQPVHPFFEGGRTDVARCADCTNRHNAEIRARNKQQARAEAASRRVEEAAPGAQYPDGRTVPREGDEVYVRTAGFGVRLRSCTVPSCVDAAGGSVCA